MTDPQQQAMPPLPEKFPSVWIPEAGCFVNISLYIREAIEDRDDEWRAYAAEAVARALAASAPTWSPGAGKSQDDFGKWLSHNDKLMGATGAADAASAPSREASEGWRLVPVEPTPRMLAAHWDEALDVCLLDHFANATRANAILARAYAAMLAAAPSTSGEGGKEGDKS